MANINTKVAASQEKFVVACERHYWITSNCSVQTSLPKLEYSELSVMVACIKYYNGECATKGTKKGDRSRLAVHLITSEIMNITEGYGLTAEVIYNFVERYEGKTHLGRIYQTGYNPKTGLVNFARRFRTRRKFMKIITSMFHEYGKVRKSAWTGPVPDWVRF